MIALSRLAMKTLIILALTISLDLHLARHHSKHSHQTIASPSAAAAVVSTIFLH
jgi:hypothetical protein